MASLQYLGNGKTEELNMSIPELDIQRQQHMCEKVVYIHPSNSISEDLTQIYLHAYKKTHG